MDFSNVRMPERQRERPTWGDYGRAAGIGVKSVADVLPSLYQYASGAGDDPDTLASIFKDWTGELAEQAFSNMTEAGQEALSARWLPDPDNPDVWDGSVNVGSAVGLQTIASIPSLAAIVGATLLGGPKGGSAAVGAIYASQAYDEAIEALKDKGPEEFADNVLYQELREQGQSHEEARSRAIQEAVGLKPLWAGLASAGAARAIGIPGQLGRGRTMPRARSAARVGAGESAAEAVQEGITAGSSQAAIYAAIGQEIDGYEIAQRATGGAVLGGVLGAGTGAAFPARSDSQPPVVGDQRQRPQLGEEQADQTLDTSDEVPTPPQVDPAEAAALREPGEAAQIASAWQDPAPAATGRTEMDPSIEAALSTEFDDAAVEPVFRQREQAQQEAPPAGRDFSPTYQEILRRNQAGEQQAAPVQEAPVETPQATPPMATPAAGRPAVSAEGIAGTVPTTDPGTAAGTMQAPLAPERSPVDPVDLSRPEYFTLQPPADALPAEPSRPDVAMEPDPNQLQLPLDERTTAQPRILPDERITNQVIADMDRAFAEMEQERQQDTRRRATERERDRRARARGAQVEGAAPAATDPQFAPTDQEWAYTQGGEQARAVMPVTEARLEAMINAAQEAGVKIPKTARRDTPTPVAMLSEAQKHLNRLQQASRGKRGLSSQHRRELADFIGRHRQAVEAPDRIDEIRQQRTIEENLTGTGRPQDARQGVRQDAPKGEITAADVGQVSVDPGQQFMAEQQQRQAEDDSGTDTLDPQVQRDIEAHKSEIDAGRDARRGEEIPDASPRRRNIQVERKRTPAPIREAATRAREVAAKRHAAKTKREKGEAQWQEVDRVTVEAAQEAAAAETVLTQTGPSLVDRFTAAFKRWFGNSQVVDAAGNPLVVYHGTSALDADGAAFSFFIPSANVESLFGKGIYFTESAQIASSYGQKGMPSVHRRGTTTEERRPNVYPVYLSIQNALDMDATAHRAAWSRAFPEVAFSDAQTGPDRTRTNEEHYRAVLKHYRETSEGGYFQTEAARLEAHEKLLAGMKRMGHDGITHMGGRRNITDEGEHRVWIAFEPTQIKSAVGNRGTYDPTNPDILAVQDDAPALTLRAAEDLGYRFRSVGQGVEVSKWGWLDRVFNSLEEALSYIGELERAFGAPVRAAEDLGYRFGSAGQGVRVRKGEWLDRVYGSLEEALAHIHDIEKTANVVSHIPRPGLNQELAQDARANPEAHGGRRTNFKARWMAMIGQLKSSENPLLRAIVTTLGPQLDRVVSDVPIYIVPRAGMEQMLLDQKAPDRTPGFYDPATRSIMIREDVLQADPDRAAHVIMHEAMHAAIDDLVKSNPKLSAQYKRLMDEVQTYYDTFTAVPGQRRPYGFENLSEFIAEGMTNQEFMKYLAGIEVSPQLAQELGLGVQRRTLWDAFIDLVNRALAAMNINVVDRSALEAFVRVTEGAITIRQAEVQAGRGREFMLERGRGTQRGEIMPLTEAVTRRGKPLMQAWKRRLQDFGLKWTTTGGLADLLQQNYPEATATQTGKQFRDAGVRAVRALLGMGNKRTRYSQEGRQYLHQLADLAKEAPETYRQFGELVREMVRNDTAVIGKVGATAEQLAKVNPHVSKTSRQDAIKRERMVRLQRQFEKLPANVRDLHINMQNYFRTRQEETVRGLIDAALLTVPQGRLTDAQRADIAERAFNRKLKDEDKQLLGDILYRDLVRNARYHKPTGTYFPGMRFGRYRVFAKAKIGDLMGGVLNRDGRQELVEFVGPTDKEAWAKAEAFLRSQTGDDLFDNGRIERRYFERETGERLDPTDATRMFEEDVEVRLYVPIQREFLTAFDSLTEARQFIEDSKGDFEQMSPEPLDAQNRGIADELDGTQLGALIKELQNSRLDENVRTEAEMAIYQASLKLMSGVRHQQRAIRTRKVRGASADVMRIFHSYNEAFAGYKARKEIYSVADEAIKQMEEVDRADPFADDRVLRQRYLTEIRNRFTGVRNYQDPNQFVADLLTISFNNYLASPGYSIINATQVAMVAYPVMAGDHGGAQAAAEIIRAYNSIGGLGTTGRGLANTLAAVKQWERLAIKTDNPVAAIKGMLAKQKDAKLLMRAWDRVQEVSLIELEAGFEVQSDQFSGRGAWGQALGKTTRIFRQLPQAVEAMNRAVTLTAAARLHYAKHGDIEAAAEYARQTVERSQGDYSAENAPELFRRNNLWRLATQFQKFPQLMAQLQIFMFKRMFQGASREEKLIAMRQFAYLAGMQVAVGGAIGLPMLELVKIPVMLASLMGMADGWEPWERWIEEVASEVTSSEKFGEAFARGLITRPLGVDVSSRINLANLVIGFGADDYDRDSVHAYIATRVLGAPGTYVTNLFSASQDAAEGDWMKAFEKAVPIKTVSDSLKAFRDQDLNIAENVLLGAGIQPAERARRFQDWRQSRTEQRQRAAQKRRLENRWRNATTATQRRLLRREIEAYNREAPWRERTYPWTWSN